MVEKGFEAEAVVRRDDPVRKAKLFIKTRQQRFGGRFPIGTSRVGTLKVDPTTGIAQPTQAQLATEAQRKILQTQERTRQEMVENERKRIANLRTNLRRQNAFSRSRDLRDARTGDLIRQETLVNRRTKERIFVTTNLKTGEKKTRTFEKANGSVRQSGGLIEAGKEEFKEISFNVEVPSSGTGSFTRAIDVGNNKMQDVRVRFSNGKIVETTLLGKPIPQTKRFKDSQKISTGTFTKAEQLDFTEKLFIKSPSFFKRIVTNVELSLPNQQKRRLELRAQLQGMKNKTTPEARRLQAELASLTLITETVGTAVAIKEIGKLVSKETGTALKQIRKDPRNIIPISKVIAIGTVPTLTKIADGILEEIKDTGTLLKTSPNEGFVKLGLIWLTFKGSGKAFKITGKAGKKAIKFAKKTAIVTTKTGIKITKTIKGRGLNLRLTGLAGRSKGKVISLKQLKAEGVSKDIQKLAEELTRRFEKQSRLRLTLSNRTDLIRAFKKQIRSRINARLPKPRKIIPPKTTIITRLKKIGKKKRKVKGRVISLKQLKAEARSNQIKEIARRTVNAEIKRTGLKINVFNRIDIEKELVKRIETAIGKSKITKTKLTKVSNKIVKKKKFFKRFLDKIKKTELQFRRKFLIKKPVSKRLRKARSQKTLIKLKELKRGLRAEALTKQIKIFSEKFANSLIKRSRERVSVFKRIDLEKTIQSGLRNALSDKKVITIKLIRQEGRKIINKPQVQTALFRQIKRPKPQFKIIKRKTIPKQRVGFRLAQVRKAPQLKPFIESNKGRLVQLQKTKLKKVAKTKKIQLQKQVKVQLKKTSSQQKQLKTLAFKQKVANKNLLKLKNKSKALSSSLFLLRSKKASASAIANATIKLNKNVSKIASANTSISKNAIAILRINKSANKTAKVITQISESISKPKEKIIAKIKKRKKQKKVTTKTIKRAFNVFAKPVKGKKLIKVNKKGLSKSDAKGLRNFLIDTSLSRQGLIKPGRGKISKPSIKVPKSFAIKTSKKFRRFKTRKGKRIPLTKGRVIEKKTRLLDTRQERKKITLRKRIKQLTPKKKVTKKATKKAVPKAQPKKKVNGARRRQLLANLKKARMARAKSLAQKRRTTTTQRTRAQRIISII